MSLAGRWMRLTGSPQTEGAIWSQDTARSVRGKQNEEFAIIGDKVGDK